MYCGFKTLECVLLFSAIHRLRECFPLKPAASWTRLQQFSGSTGEWMILTRAIDFNARPGTGCGRHDPASPTRFFRSDRLAFLSRQRFWGAEQNPNQSKTLNEQEFIRLGMLHSLAARFRTTQNDRANGRPAIENVPMAFGQDETLDPCVPSAEYARPPASLSPKKKKRRGKRGVRKSKKQVMECVVACPLRSRPYIPHRHPHAKTRHEKEKHWETRIYCLVLSLPSALFAWWNNTMRTNWRLSKHVQIQSTLRLVLGWGHVVRGSKLLCGHRLRANADCQNRGYPALPDCWRPTGVKILKFVPKCPARARWKVLCA